MNKKDFYRGGHFRYGSDGQLLEKAEPGYWSRDGTQVEELMVAIATVVGGKLLVIDAQRIAHLMEQAGDGDADGHADGHPEEASQKKKHLRS
jgi:hypothetical protein